VSAFLTGTLFAWMEKKGVDQRGSRLSLLRHQSKAQRSMQLSQAHGLDGVPALVVQGKYKPAAGATGSYGDVLVTLVKLIAKARAEQGKK
jgi:thiol:disulfide interchange protein DsbA